MLKVGIIGSGKNGAGHAACLNAIEEARIVAFADVAYENAQALAERYNAKAFHDHRELLDHGVDAVWICSPQFVHAEQAVDAAEAGVHVMCEKPMALTLDEADAMIGAAKKNSTKLMIGQSTRYSHQLSKMKAMLEAGDLGRLVACWSTRLGHHQPPSPNHWRMDPAKSGGVKLEWEVHEIDVLRCFGGRVLTVSGKVAYGREDAPSFDDTFAAILGFENGALGRLDASQAARIGFTNRGIMGTKGMAYARGQDEIVLRSEKHPSGNVVKVDLPEYLTGEVRLAKKGQDGDFIRAILDNDKSPISGEDGRADIEIALAILESSQKDEVIRLDLAPEVSSPSFRV